MKLRVICVGRLKESFFRDACSEYAKRLSRFCELEVTELADEKVAKDPSPAEIARVMETESSRIAEKLDRSDYTIALDPAGKELSSEELSELIDRLKLEGHGRVAFLIGGSHGLTRELKSRADMTLSFSRLTFPHQLFRVMLLEQLYRAFKISSGEAYHK